MLVLTRVKLMSRDFDTMEPDLCMVEKGQC